MRAQVLHDINALIYEEVSKPEPGEGEVLVKVCAAGVCGSDIPRIYRTGAHRMPLIPGHEFAGEVVGTGAGVSGDWMGKRVGIFPLIPCKKCAMCRAGHYELCRDYDYIGSRRNGAFAEYVTVPEWNLVRLPDNVTFPQAAMMEPMAVAVHAMRRGLNDPGEKMRSAVVLGLGTIGTLLVMFLKEAGVKELYVIGNKEPQRRRMEILGIPVKQYCDGKKEDSADWLLKRNGSGADMVFECVGTAQACTEAIRLAAPMGNVVLVGNPAGDMALSQNDYWKILRNQLTITGTWNSAFGENTDDDWGYVLKRLEEGRICPEKLITQTFSLKDLPRGLEIMRDKTEDFCKVMVTF